MSKFNENGDFFQGLFWATILGGLLWTLVIVGLWW